MQVKDSNPPKAVVACIGVMVAEAPFVRWYHVKYPLQGSPTEGFYYVYTAALVTTVAATASNRRCNRVAYKVHRSLRRGYSGILPLGTVLRWNTSEALVIWLASIIYYSFLRYSGPGGYDQAVMKMISVSKTR